MPCNLHLELVCWFLGVFIDVQCENVEGDTVIIPQYHSMVT
jgi:hypothetical protein